MTGLEPSPTAVVYFLACASALILVLARWRPPCECERCEWHSRLRELERERSLARRHREMHAVHNRPWGPEHCGVCRDRPDDHGVQ